MPQRKLQDGLANLERAMANLERAVTLPKEQELVLECTIQRFETKIEIFWNVLKRALEFEGLVIKTPRESLKGAFRDRLATRRATLAGYACQPQHDLTSISRRRIGRTELRGHQAERSDVARDLRPVAATISRWRRQLLIHSSVASSLSVGLPPCL